MADVKILDFHPMMNTSLPEIESWYSDKELRQRLGGMLPLQKWFDDISTTPSQRAWEAYAQGELIGFANLETHDNGTGSIAIAIKPQQRGKGLGKQLVEFLIAYSKDVKLKKLMAGIESDNIASIRCFESIGFICENEKPDDDGFLSYMYKICADKST